MGVTSITEIRKISLQGISALLILLFSYAAISKIADFGTFEWQMLNQPLPRVINQSLIWLVPSTEIIAVLLLVFKSTQRLGLIAAAMLMSAFTIYVGAVVFHFFSRVPCSCGGVLRGMSWEEHLVFNLFFVGVSWVGVWVRREVKS